MIKPAPQTACTPAVRKPALHSRPSPLRCPNSPAAYGYARAARPRDMHAPHRWLKNAELSHHQQKNTELGSISKSQNASARSESETVLASCQAVLLEKVPEIHVRSLVRYVHNVALRLTYARIENGDKRVSLSIVGRRATDIHCTCDDSEPHGSLYINPLQ